MQDLMQDPMQDNTLEDDDVRRLPQQGEVSSETSNMDIYKEHLQEEKLKKQENLKQIAAQNWGRQPSYVSKNRARKEAQEEADKITAGEVWGLAVDRNWVSGGFARQMTRQNSEIDDFTFQLPEHEVQEIVQTHSEKEAAYLMSAVSERDYFTRKAHIEEDRFVAERIAQAGGMGVGLELAAAVLDPSMALLMFTPAAGIAAANKLSVAGRLARSFAVGSLEGFGVEAYMMQSDTQRDWTDVLFSTAASGVFSSAMTGAGIGVRALHKNITSQNALYRQQAEANLQSVREGNQLAEDMVNDIDIGRSQDSAMQQLRTDTARAEAGIALHKELSGGSSTSPSSRLHKAQSDSLDAEIKAVSKKLEDMRNRKSKGGDGRKRARLEKKEADLRAKKSELAKAKPRMNAKEYEELVSDLEKIEQGHIPERHKERFKEILDEQTPLLAREERRMLREATAARDEGISARADTEPESATVESESFDESGTVGAAKVAGYKDKGDTFIPTEEEAVLGHIGRAIERAEEVPKSWQMKIFGNKGVRYKLQSLSTTLNNNPSPVIRGLASFLLNNTQGLNKGVSNAAVTRDVALARINAAEGGQEHQAMLLYAKERGMSHKETFGLLIAHPEVRAKYDNEVVEALISGRSDSPAIQLAVKARADTLEAGLKIRKEYGEEAFKEIEADRRYWPFLPDQYKMQDAMSSTNFGRTAVEDLITKSYMTGRYKIPEKAARIIAMATIERTMHRTLKSISKAETILTDRNRALIAKEMKAAGIDDSVAESVLKEIGEMTHRENLNSRARTSLGANMQATHNGLSMLDILDTSRQVTTRYSAEAAGGAGIASQGFGSRAELEATIREAERSEVTYLDSFRHTDPKEAKKAQAEKAEVQDGAGALIDAVRLLFGETLDAPRGKEVSTAVKASRIARAATTAVRLGTNGVTSAVDTGNVLARVGLLQYISKFPKALDTGVGKPKVRSDLMEMYEAVMGVHGHLEDYVGRSNYNMGNIGEDAATGFERMANNITGSVQDHVMFLSGNRFVTNTNSTLQLNAMLDNFHKVAIGKKKPNKRDLKELEQGGLKPEQYEELMQWIRDNRQKADDGSFTINAEGMPVELRHSMGAAMRYVLSNGMQRNFIGDTSLFLNKELGKLGLQFENYGLVATEKQLINGIRNAPAVLGTAMMYSTALALALYKGRVILNSKTQDDPESYIERRMQWDDMLHGVSLMHSQLGIMNLYWKTFDTIGLPTDWYMEEESGRYIPDRGAAAIPALGLVTDAAKSVGMALPALYKGIQEGSDAPEVQSFMTQLQRTLPYVKTTAVLSAIATAGALKD